MNDVVVGWMMSNDDSFLSELCRGWRGVQPLISPAPQFIPPSSHFSPSPEKTKYSLQFLHILQVLPKQPFLPYSSKVSPVKILLFASTHTTDG